MYRAGLSWVVFLVLGGAMGYLRYGHCLTPEQLTLMTTYAPWVVVLIHVVVVLIAFSDTVFQGILCLLIPFYSFYYILFISDAFLIRAIVAGLLVGLGQDAALFFQREANRLIDVVQKWIAAGGGSL